MNTQHTPGPWVFGETACGTLNLRTGQPSMRPDGFCVTAVEPRKYGGTTIVKNGLSLADARLIAAAPELLASLREVLSTFEAGNDDDISFDPMLIRARSAIAKATGTFEIQTRPTEK